MPEGHKLRDGILGVLSTRINVLACVETRIKEETIDIVIATLNASEKKRVR